VPGPQYLAVTRGVNYPAAWAADALPGTRRARGAALLLAAGTLAVTAAGLALMVWDWSTPLPRTFFGVRGFDGVFAITFGGLGALLTWRRPAHLIGWIFAAAAMLLAVSFTGFEYGLAASAGHVLPAGRYFGWVQMWIWVPFVTLLVVYVFLLFPTGHLAGRRWRLVGWLGGGFAAVAVAGIAVLPGGEAPNLPQLRNPFGIAPAPAAYAATVTGLAGLVGCGVLAAWSLVTRARTGPAVERQQVKWLAYSGCLVAVALVPAVSLSLTPGVGARIAAGALMAAVLTMPVAVVIAVLRYRLYDLDIIVRKTVVAALVAAAFTAVYALVVAGIGTLIGQSAGRPLTFAGAAIAAAALQPIRVRAARLADRVVYGKRATPYEVLAAFSEQVADSYPVAGVLPRVARMLGEATGAIRAEVWMRAGRTERLMAAWPTADRPATAPDAVIEVAHQGERLGSLRLVASPREPLTPAARRLVQAVAGQAGLLLRNIGLVEDLRASRQRLVATADEARRSLERDLHDGAQQQLVALRIALRLAREAVHDSPDEAAELLAQTEKTASDALTELRALAHGIYPPLLADHGLPAALQAHARKTGLRVVVDADATGRYPQQAEAAVYFAISEALQNVAKYAQASATQVTLRQDGSWLTFTVADDGKGYDQAMTPIGSGVQGMTDRMAALGGTLEISSAYGHGTTVTGCIPVPG
jgi:signal transduction histidine kinase